MRMSVHSITQKPHGRTSPSFLCMLPAAVAWFSSDSVVIRYAFPVLQMTPCFHTIRPMGQNQVRCYILKFTRWQHPYVPTYWEQWVQWHTHRNGLSVFLKILYFCC